MILLSYREYIILYLTRVWISTNFNVERMRVVNIVRLIYMRGLLKAHYMYKQNTFTL